MGKRLLAIYVLPHCQGRGRDRGMSMVRSSYHDTVDLVTQLIEHLPPVPITFSVREFLEAVLRIFPVDIAKPDDVLGFHADQVWVAFTTDTDTDNIHCITWCLMA